MDRINHESFKNNVQGQKGYVLMAFLSLNFLPSVLLKRALDELESEFKDIIKFYYVDITKDSKLTIDLNVMSSPKMLILEDGIEIASSLGGASKTFIKEFILANIKN